MPQILASGRFLRLVSRDGWEWTERTTATGVVVVVALTPARAVVFVEQFRPPVYARVIELPAGLAGDVLGAEDEALETAARRELLEETGYACETMTAVTEGPVSAGMTSERITLFVADGLSRVHPGGGDATEDIVVHEVPLADARRWLVEQQGRGAHVDPKVYAGLWFAERALR